MAHFTFFTNLKTAEVYYTIPEIETKSLGNSQIRFHPESFRLKLGGR